jgi:hypothetical protein
MNVREQRRSNKNGGHIMVKSDYGQTVDKKWLNMFDPLLAAWVRANAQAEKNMFK